MNGKLTLVSENRLRQLLKIEQAAARYLDFIDLIVPRIETTTSLKSAKGNAGRIRINQTLRDALKKLD